MSLTERLPTCQQAIVAVPRCNRGHARQCCYQVGQAFGQRHFRTALLAITILSTLTYFFHIMTFYFLLKWIPKIVFDMHFPATAGANVLVWANVGGATGGALLGLLSQRVGLKPLTIGVMLLSTVMVVLFGRSSPDLTDCHGCAPGRDSSPTPPSSACMPSMHRRSQHTCAPRARVSRSGWGGAAPCSGRLRPAIFQVGYTLPTVATYMALGSLLAAGILALLPSSLLSRLPSPC